jgi:hypothetical protein
VNLPGETPPKDGNQVRLRVWFARLSADAADIRRAFAFACAAWDAWPERWQALDAYKVKHGLPWTDDAMERTLSAWDKRVRRTLNSRRRFYP